MVSSSPEANAPQDRSSVPYSALPNHELEAASQADPFDAFEPIEGHVFKTRDELEQFMQDHLRRSSRSTNRLDAINQVLWNPESGQAWLGHGYQDAAVTRQKAGLLLFQGELSPDDDEFHFWEHEDDQRNADRAHRTNEVSEPFASAGDAQLWQEIEDTVTWDHSQVEVVGGPYGDCLQAMERSAVYPDIDPQERWMVFSVYSSQTPEAWAQRIGRNCVIYRNHKKQDVEILVPID